MCARARLRSKSVHCCYCVHVVSYFSLVLTAFFSSYWSKLRNNGLWRLERIIVLLFNDYLLLVSNSLPFFSSSIFCLLSHFRWYNSLLTRDINWFNNIFFSIWTEKKNNNQMIWIFVMHVLCMRACVHVNGWNEATHNLFDKLISME